MPSVESIVPDVAAWQQESGPALSINYLPMLMLRAGNVFYPTTDAAYPTASIGGRGGPSTDVSWLFA